MIPVAVIIGLFWTIAIAWSVIAPLGNDWRILERAAALDGNPYGLGDYVYTPAFTWLFAVMILPLGLHAVQIFHLLSLALIRDRLIVAAAVLTPAFWMTVALGNIYWFTILFGILAIRGSRWATVASVIAFALLPRPLIAPLIGWLLIRDAWLRLPAVLIGLVAVLASMATGQADDWFSAAVSLSGNYPWNDWNVGPTRLVGSWWLFLGVPLAIWLTARGHPGWAGLAISAYLVPPYFLVLLWELTPRLARTPTVGGRETSGARTAATT